MCRCVSMDAKSFLAGIIVSSALLAVALAIYFPAASLQANDACPSLQPLFSPDSSDEIIAMMRSAQKTIDIEMYVFTDDALARELVDAQKRGVKVRVILESRVESKASTQTIPAALEAGGIEVRWASLSYALTHSKMMVIDGKKVLVGSINFSKNAQHRNREAAAIIGCGEKVAEYSAVFEKDWTDATIAPRAP